MELQILGYDFENQNFETWTKSHLELLYKKINNSEELSDDETKYKFFLYNLIVLYIKWCKNNTKDIYELMYTPLNREIIIVNNNNELQNNNNELRNTNNELRNLGLIQLESASFRRNVDIRFKKHIYIYICLFILVIVIVLANYY